MKTNDKNVTLKLENLEERAVPAAYVTIGGQVVYDIGRFDHMVTNRDTTPVKQAAFAPKTPQVSYNYNWNMYTQVAYVYSSGREFAVNTGGMLLKNATPVPTVSKITYDTKLTKIANNSDTRVTDSVFSNSLGFSLGSQARLVNGTVQWNQSPFGRRF